jgi:pilus assembly protein CpaF
MFGRLNRSSEAQPAASGAGPLDRLGRRGGEQRPDIAATPADRETRLAAAAASLAAAVGPRLRQLIGAGVPAGEVARQAGQQAQIHFRQNGVMLSPLELRGYVGEVLRPLLPAQSFNTPDEPEPAEPAPPAAPAAEVAAGPPIIVESPQVEAKPPAEPKLIEAKSAVAWDAPQQTLRADDKSTSRLSRSKVDQARRSIQPLIMRRIDLAAAVSLPRKELVRQLEGLVGELLAEQRVQLNRPEQ